MSVTTGKCRELLFNGFLFFSIGCNNYNNNISSGVERIVFLMPKKQLQQLRSHTNKDVHICFV